jgi:hypothetical protein
VLVVGGVEAEVGVVRSEVRWTGAKLRQFASTCVWGGEIDCCLLLLPGLHAATFCAMQL